MGCWLRARFTLLLFVVDDGDSGGFCAVAAVEEGDRVAACMASKCGTSPTMPLSMRRCEGEGGNTSAIDGGVLGRGDGG